jgi:predicted transcriptional regulator
MLINYMEQLKRMARDKNVNLKQAFVAAGIPDSTYYRALTGGRSLRFPTAEKVAGYLGEQDRGTSQGTFDGTEPDREPVLS